jgi:hypothetical protein
MPPTTRAASVTRVSEFFYEEDLTSITMALDEVKLVKLESPSDWNVWIKDLRTYVIKYDVWQ